MRVLFLSALALISIHAAKGSIFEKDGGGWTLVRRVKAGSTWHPATDHLAGTDVYGVATNDPTADVTFSVAFDETPFDQFMFATGDGTKWLIADKSDVYGNYAGEARSIQSSSLNNFAHVAIWYNRASAPEDPWISLTDHSDSLKNGGVLYGGQSWPLTVGNNGANVFIRSTATGSPTSSPTGSPTTSAPSGGYAAVDGDQVWKCDSSSRCFHFDNNSFVGPSTPSLNAVVHSEGSSFSTTAGSWTVGANKLNLQPNAKQTFGWVFECTCSQ